MILLDNLIYFLKPGLAGLLIPFFFACNDPTELGLGLERNDEKIQVRDTTLILPTSTIYIDSLRTDQYTSTAFGKFSDDVYGTVTAISNNQYNLGGGTFPGDTLEFVSAELKFKISDVRAKLLLSDEHVTIYESSDSIFNVVYLRNRALSKTGDPIADYDFSYDPEIDSVITIPLDQAFGQSLYSKLLKASLDDDFKDSLLRNKLFYKALVIEPGTSNQGLFSFDLSNETTAIYVHMENENIADDSTYAFTWDFNTTPRFTSVERSKDGVELNEEKDYDEIIIDSNKTYLSPLNGVTTKIDLTPLIELFNSSEHIIFNTIQLSLATASSGSPYIKPVNQLNFYFEEDDGTIDATSVENGELITHIMLTENSYYNLSSQTPLTMNYNSENMIYSSSITLFAQALGASYDQGTGDNLTKGLILISPAGIGLGQTSFLKDEVKLTIYYSMLLE